MLEFVASDADTGSLVGIACNREIACNRSFESLELEIAACYRSLFNLELEFLFSLTLALF